MYTLYDFVLLKIVNTIISLKIQITFAKQQKQHPQHPITDISKLLTLQQLLDEIVNNFVKPKICFNDHP